MDVWFDKSAETCEIFSGTGGLVFLSSRYPLKTTKVMYCFLFVYTSRRAVFTEGCVLSWRQKETIPSIERKLDSLIPSGVLWSLLSDSPAILLSNSYHPTYLGNLGNVLGA